MIPWVQLDTAKVPGGDEFKLMQRGDDEFRAYRNPPPPVPPPLGREVQASLGEKQHRQRAKQHAN